MTPSHCVRSAGLLLAIAAVLAACGGARPAVPSASGAAPSRLPSQAGAASPAAAASAAASSPGQQKISVSFSSVSFAQIALPVAKESGLFGQNGLEVELVLGPNGIPALLSGQMAAAVTATEQVILADLGGADLEIVASMVPYMQHQFIVRPEIRTMKDLLGKPVGISSRGSITDTVVRMAAERGGVDYKKLQIVEMRTSGEGVAALTAGSIYGMSFTRPDSDVAISQGAHILYDFHAERVEFPEADVIVTRHWAGKNEPIVLGFLRSLAQAVSLTHTKPDYVAGIYGRWSNHGEKAGQTAVKLAKDVIPIKMLPTLEGIKAVQASVATQRPEAASFDTTKLFDDRYIKKLDAEGFYAQLAK